MALRPLQPRSTKKPLTLGEALGGRTRWKLLAMFVTLFLVIRLIDVVRQPEAWRWFFRMNGIPVGEVEIRPESIPDPKLPFRPDESLPAGVFISQGTQPIIRPDEEPTADEKSATELSPGSANEAIDTVVENDPLPRVWKEAWRDIYHHLEFHERGTIYRALKAGRDGKELTEEQGLKLEETVARLDRAWTTYQAEAIAALFSVSDEEKLQWLDVLNRSSSHWRMSLKPALIKVANSKPLSEGDQEEILALQDLLDEILLREVEDDTVWRASETEISFRLFERVREFAKSPPKRADVTSVSYLQLAKQSPEYRGKLVHVSGVARQAWHVQAPKNWVGIEGYYVFVLKPSEVNSPLIIYSLELPPDFPPVKDKDIDGETTELNVEMEFTGLYLKRWAYVGRDGTYTAPLIVSHQGSWTPREQAFSGFGTETLQWMPQVIGWGLTTLVLAAVVIWYFRPRPAPVLSLPEQLGEGVNQMTQQSVTEKLRGLELGRDVGAGD